MRISSSRSLARAVAAVAGATVLLAACGGGSDTGSSGSSGGSSADQPGLTSSSIKIGTHMPLTGVAAPGYSEIPVGAKAYFDYLNDQGGINGRTIEYLVRDDGYNPTNTTNVTNQLVLQDKVFSMIQGLGTPTHSAVLDFLDENDVPDLFVSSGALAWNQPDKYPNTFGWQPDYTVEGKVMGKYIADNMPNAKVGLFLQGDDFGRDGAAGVKQFLSNQIVQEVTYTSGNTDVSPQIQQLKASGADVVLGFNVPAYTALSQLQGLGAGLQAAVVLLRRRPGRQPRRRAAQPLLQGQRDRPGAARGHLHHRLPQRQRQDRRPVGPALDEGLAGQGRRQAAHELPDLYGMAGAYTFAQTVAAAGKDLTREGLVKALEAKGGKFQGPALAPFDYSKDSHRGISGVKVVQVKSGVPVDVTRRADHRRQGRPVEASTYTPPAPPANGVPTG